MNNDIKDTFKINVEDINVVKIMDQIRENVRIRNYPNTNLPDMHEIKNSLKGDKGVEYNLDELNKNIGLNNRRWQIDFNRPITSHRRFVGKFIVLGKRIVRRVLKWHTESLFEQQIVFNATVTRTLNEIYEFVKYGSREFELHENVLKKLLDSINEKDKKIDELSNQIEKIELMLNDESTKLHTQITDVRKNTYSKSDIDQIEKKLEDIIRNLKEISNIENSCKILENKNEETIEKFNNLSFNVKSNIEKLKQENTVTNSRLRRIERNLKNMNYPIKDPGLIIQNPQEKIDLDYFLFNERFGGSEEEIKEKFKQYIKYFKNKSNILEIGCGKGRFLELLIENGISEFKGIDIDDDMVQYCKEKGFPVENADVFSYLEEVPDNSLGGIFLGQVIEHFSPSQIIKLVRLAYKKLKPTAYFVAETINPESLYVFTTSYLLDPTHIRMVHPETIKFILESEGFNQLEIKYLSPVDENLKLPYSNHDEFNEIIQKLNKIIFGHRDFAVIGKK